MNQKLKLVGPTRSPERQALAGAQAAHVDARHAADAARAAAERARGLLVAAKGKHATAGAALAAARENAIGAATSEGASPVDLRELRRAEADARDQVDIAAEALRRAEAATVAPERAERHLHEAIEVAADAVLAANFEVTYDAALAAARMMARLAWLAERMGEASDAYDGTAHRRAGDARCLNPRSTLPVAEVNDAEAAARAEFDAARAALLTDADANLPEICR